MSLGLSKDFMAALNRRCRSVGAGQFGAAHTLGRDLFVNPLMVFYTCQAESAATVATGSIVVTVLREAVCVEIHIGFVTQVLTVPLPGDPFGGI